MNNPAISSKLLDDVETVLHKDFIYLDFDVPMFREWVKAILQENNLQRIVYLFDEFPPVHRGEQRAVEDFRGCYRISGRELHFFLVPVTHMEIKGVLSRRV